MKKLLKKYRQELHTIPEISMNEYKTKDYIIKELENIGYSPQSILETGVYLYIDNQKERTIAFRADMDALSISENTGVDFKSKHDGYMHACGHDGHMATLLCLAKYLKDSKEHINVNVLLIFQPAEEGLGGAKPIVETGLLNKYNVESIFGLHLFPELEEGVVASRPNELMAQNTEVDITITGKSAHGAMAYTGVDSILVTTKLLADFQSIISREISPLDYAVIHYGKITGGTARNIVAESTTIEGTIRTFSVELTNFIINRINEIARGYEIAYNVKIDVNVLYGYLPVINNENLYDTFKDSIKDMNYFELPKPYMIAEDFSFYQNAIPGVFFFVGTKNIAKNYVYPLHSSKFNFDESALLYGLNAYINIIQHYSKN